MAVCKARGLRYDKSRMQIHFEFQGDVCILRLEGRFATGQDSEYLQLKTNELKSNKYLRVVADFGKVSYMDSTGIGFLIAVYTSIGKTGAGHFAVSNPNKKVREVLDLTRVSQVIPVFDNELAALEAVKG